MFENLLALHLDLRGVLNKEQKKMSQPVPEFKPNLEKLKKLQQQASSVVIGGKVN
jgi:hypothetical protein